MINILEAFVLLSVFTFQIRLVYKICALFVGKPYSCNKMIFMSYLKNDCKLKQNKDLQDKIANLTDTKNKSSIKRKIIAFFALLISSVLTIIFWSKNINVSNNGLFIPIFKRFHN
jgi:hypothetical protein